MRKIYLLLVLGLLIGGCATIPAKTYEDTVSGWTSYKDVEKWMSENFVYDYSLLKDALNNRGGIVRSPRETFKLKSGICWDGARFIQETLNLIDPSYDAQIVFINKPFDPPHYVCSFKINGKLYIMDYSTVHRDKIGIFGPFGSLEDYKNSCGMTVQSISFGWPSFMENRLEK